MLIHSGISLPPKMDEVVKTVVVAEDDPEIVLLLKHALKKDPIPARFHFLPNGVSLMRYLAGHQEFSDRSFYALPDLVILDLKMPFFDAIQTLPSLRTDPNTSHVPVFVFTDEKDPSRVKSAYHAGASAYFIKPTEPVQLRNVLALMVSMDFHLFPSSTYYRPSP